MRHASSNMNIISKYYNNISFHMPFYKLKHMPMLVDCGLSLMGKLEIQGLKPILNEYNIKYIFTSPLRRTLETCLFMINTQKPVHAPKIIVEPNLREFLMNQSDIPVYYRKAMTMPEFKDFDFSELRRYDKNPLWFIENYLGEPLEIIKESNAILEMINTNDSISINEYIEYVLYRMKDCFPKSLETEMNLKHRVSTSLDHISNYLTSEVFMKGEVINDNEVLIISHFNIINCIHNELIDEDGSIGDFLPTEISEISIDI